MYRLYILLIVILFLHITLLAQEGWFEQTSGTTEGLYTCRFISENIGWASGNDGTILKTTDGGETWFSQSFVTSDNSRSIFFTDSLNGWAAFYEWSPIRHGSVYYTADGGNTWVQQLTLNDFALLSIFFLDPSVGWVVGTNGIIFKTTNSGGNWIQLSTGTSYWLYSVYFIDESIGWICGGGQTLGLIMKTTNGGSNWFTQQPQGEALFVDVFFINSSTGWIVGQDGKILFTTNGGNNWNVSNSPVSQELRSVQFIDNNQGWIAGFGGTILHSINGGINWKVQNSSTTMDLYELSFINNMNGWAVGNNGTILHTINGGIPVELVSFSAIVNVNNVSLSWITASELNNSGFEIQRKNRIKNKDWQKITFIKGEGTTTESQYYIFVDENVTIGRYHYRLKQLDYDGTYEYSNIIQVEVGSTTDFSLKQNYPNPFNPTTTIKYHIPELSIVSIKLFDVLGNEVAILVNEEKPAGSYEVVFDRTGLSSGIYFYKLQAGSFAETKKMILIK